MWHHRVRALLRLVALSLLLGLIPPAATPQAHSAAIAGPPAANASTPAATTQPTPAKPITSTPVPHPEPPPPSIPAKAPIVAPTAQNLSALPLSFVPNVGQQDPAVRYQVHGLGGTIFLRLVKLC